MDEEARDAIVEVLTGSSPLFPLLAQDPDATGVPAVFLYRRSGTPAVYPCLVYRFTEAVPDERFRPTNAEGGGESPIVDGRMELRIYNKSTVTKRDAIASAVRGLLEGKVLPFTTGLDRLFRVEILTELPDSWDPAINDFYYLMRFRLRQFKATA